MFLSSNYVGIENKTNLKSMRFKMETSNTDTKLVLIVTAVVLAIYIGVFVYFINDTNSYRNKCESFVGEKIVVCNDTLMITNFDSNEGVFNMNNKSVMEPKLVFKILGE